MKRIYLVFVGVGCMLFQSAQATLLFSEAFNYSPGNAYRQGQPRQQHLDDRQFRF